MIKNPGANPNAATGTVTSVGLTSTDGSLTITGSPVTGSGNINAVVTAGSTPKLLYQFGVPVGIAPTGTMGNNGAVTLGTSLQTTFPNCYLAFPANAISAGSAAGIYFVQMTSGTAGTVFNNVLASGPPVIPGAPTPFATTGPGAYTGLTGSQTLLTLSIAANSFGANGLLNYEGAWEINSNANAKTYTVSYGGTNIQGANVGTSIGWLGFRRSIRSRGATNAQTFFSTAITNAVTDITGNASSISTGAIDTTTAQNLVLSFNSGTATDFALLLGLTVTSYFAA